MTIKKPIKSAGGSNLLKYDSSFDIEESKTILPADYEACGICGFDHSYEYREAAEWHVKNDEKVN